MKSRRDSTDLAATELRNLLMVAHDAPGRYRDVVARVLSERARWLPTLVSLATRDRAPVQALAVEVLNALVSEAATVADLADLLAALPRKSSAVADLAARLTARLIDLFPESLRAADLEAAKLWNNLSERSQDANRPEEALRCAQRAVEVSRAVPDAAPGIKPVRVTTLLTLSKRHAERDDGRPALEAAAAAFDLASDLAVSGTRADRWLEAQAAMTLANRFSAVGDSEHALAAAHKARRFLAECEDDKSMRYDLALLDHFLSSHLTRQGHHEAALPYADNADRLFRILTADNPDEYQEYSAAAAYTYAINLTQIGDVQRAYDLSWYAVKRMEPLVKRQPVRFGAEHVAYLLGLSDSAAEVGKFDEALDGARKAVLAARRLGRQQARRDWYLEGQTHVNQFRLLYRLQRFPEAATAIRAAFRAFRALSDAHPEAVIERARSLRNLAEVERMTGAKVAATRAVASARQSLAQLVAHVGPPTEAVLLLESQCRTTLANCLEEAGQLAGAIQEDETSLRIRRDLFARSPVVHRPDLAYGLLQSAKRSLQAGRIDAASALATECVDHYETIGENGEEQGIAFFADALRTLGDTAAAKGDNAGAVANVTRALGLLRPRYAAAPDLWLVSILPICVRYVELCAVAQTAFDPKLVADVIAHAQRSEARPS